MMQKSQSEMPFSGKRTSSSELLNPMTSITSKSSKRGIEYLPVVKHSSQDDENRANNQDIATFTYQTTNLLDPKKFKESQPVAKTAKHS